MDFSSMDSVARSLLAGGAFLISLAVTFFVFYDAESRGTPAAFWKGAGILAAVLTLPALAFSALKLGVERQGWVNPLGWLGIFGLMLALLTGVLYWIVGQRRLAEQEEAVAQTHPDLAGTQIIQTRVKEPPPPVLGYLVPKTGPLTGKAFRLATSTDIGRHEDNDIILEDEYASDRHARVKFQDGRYVFYDRASTNGSWLIDGSDKEKIAAPHALGQGDVIEIGDTRFVFLEVEM